MIVVFDALPLTERVKSGTTSLKRFFGDVGRSGVEIRPVSIKIMAGHTDRLAGRQNHRLQFNLEKWIMTSKQPMAIAPQKTFSVDLEKEDLIFSVAHFITFGENICEAIHGHNYRLRCQLVGPLQTHAYVFDFIALRDHLKAIVKELDHHVLLPDRHPTILVQRHGEAVIVRFAAKKWEFPASDVAILPIDNTTAERLAEYIGDRLLQQLPELSTTISQLTVGVDENEGQWGCCRWNWGGP